MCYRKPKKISVETKIGIFIYLHNFESVCIVTLYIKMKNLLFFIFMFACYSCYFFRFTVYLDLSTKILPSTSGNSLVPRANITLKPIILHEQITYIYILIKNHLDLCLKTIYCLNFSDILRCKYTHYKSYMKN